MLLCLAKRNEICNLENEKKQITEKQIEFTKLFNKIHNTKFNFSKTKEDVIKKKIKVSKKLLLAFRRKHT